MSSDETEKRIADFSVYTPNFEVRSGDSITGFWEFGDGAFRIKKGPTGYDPETQVAINRHQLKCVKNVESRSEAVNAQSQSLLDEASAFHEDDDQKSDGI